MNNSPTPIVVGSLIGICLVTTAYHLAGWVGGTVLTAILIYEGWTLTNKFPNDTISEIIWKFSQRPWIPWMFGFASGWALGTKNLSDPYLILSLGFLSGHFFFQEAK